MYNAALLALAVSSLATNTQALVREKRQAPSGVPDFVTKYAPIVYLYSGDPFFPSDIGAQLQNTQPEVNFAVVSGAPSPLTLDNVNELNNHGSNNVYLTSIQDPTTNPMPAYLYGVRPDSSGKTDGAVSCAIIVNDHGSGLVDAFYMYFYAFNYGGRYGIGDIRYIIGNHVGDWEHNMVRFENGVPTAVWYSQHSNGQAFTYQAVNKTSDGIRPVVLSANGSHANYAIGGKHDHTIPDLNLPDGFLLDYTDFGPMWDPALSAHYYSYDAATKTFKAYDASSPVNWLYYLGRWGDEQYPESDRKQRCVPVLSKITDALCKYTDGPTGPINKKLDRKRVCPDDDDLCIVRTELAP
ncbi:Vacuolar protein sorting-associated protein 62 [Teratosphaeria destructans]|uniref:Vacuolar protein sorting-associated protein 62 n=1 Tax=Teratosphaeria destructans TaxID=418781 RepID=A0A9W7W3C1_9PEZI|nr:Vacuolar protein sorting-associated protein 62 [Teratosphaeria destructans]